MRQSASRNGRSGTRSCFPRTTMCRVLLALCVSAGALSAQSRGDRVSILPGTALRSAAGGEIIGITHRAVSGTIEATSPEFVRLTIQGHVSSDDVRLTADRTRGEVLPSDGSALRSTAARSGNALATLKKGAYLFPERQGARFPGSGADYIEARRTLWVAKSRLGEAVAERVIAERTSAPAARTVPAKTAPSKSATASSASAKEPAPATVSDTAAGQLDAELPPAPRGEPTLETRGAPSLRLGPKGDVLATMSGGVPLTTLAREDGWVRVRLEGWLPDSAVEAAGAGATGALSAADLRADPDGTRGRVVRWTVESLAFQTADDLRSGLTPGEPYLLARGPDEERAVLYLAIPDALVGQARALRPLARITVTARVRNGHSRPAGVPVLELLELSRP